MVITIAAARASRPEKSSATGFVRANVELAEGSSFPFPIITLKHCPFGLIVDQRLSRAESWHWLSSGKYVETVTSPVEETEALYCIS